MKRRAILIFNDGGPSNYLPGVKLDKANYLNFLKSDEGGAWEENEIKVFDNNCSRELLLNYIDFWRRIEQTAYWLIIFSGHGYTNDKNEAILELSSSKECSVNEIKNATDNTRRLLIADSCRSVIHSITDSLKRERKLFSEKATADSHRERCRALYMDQLENVYKDSFNAAYAAEYDQCANDDDTTGGYYSYELLKAANTMIEDRKASYRIDDWVVPFENFHKVAREAVIAKSSGSQMPTTEGLWLDTIPFVVIPRS